MDQAIDQLENGVLMLSAIRFKMHVLFLTTTQVDHFFVATGMAVVARLDLPASSARWGGKRQMARLHCDFFIGPESDHWLCLSVTPSLTH